MECPRCKLINPDTAVRCDCGYDFESRTVETPYFTQELPKTIRTYLVVFIVLNVIGFCAGLVAGDMIRVLVELIWTGVFAFFYLNLVRKKNWARMTLVVLTFPVGIMLRGAEARLYCLQKA